MIDFPLAPEWLCYFIAFEIGVIFFLCIVSLVLEIVFRIFGRDDRFRED